jgi:hypothetical protein
MPLKSPPPQVIDVSPADSGVPRGPLEFEQPEPRWSPARKATAATAMVVVIGGAVLLATAQLGWQRSPTRPYLVDRPAGSEDARALRNLPQRSVSPPRSPTTERDATEQARTPVRRQLRGNGRAARNASPPSRPGTRRDHPAPRRSQIPLPGGNVPAPALPAVTAKPPQVVSPRPAAPGAPTPAATTSREFF